MPVLPVLQAKYHLISAQDHLALRLFMPHASAVFFDSEADKMMCSADWCTWPVFCGINAPESMAHIYGKGGQ